MIRTATTLTAIALLSAVAPATAKPIYYDGKTDDGSPISFQRSGSKISRIQGTIATTCVSPDSQVPRSGGDLSKPPGAFRSGTTRKATVKQDTAFFHDPVTKNYRITVKRTAAACSRSAR